MGELRTESVPPVPPGARKHRCQCVRPDPPALRFIVAYTSCADGYTSELAQDIPYYYHYFPEVRN